MPEATSLTFAFPLQETYALARENLALFLPVIYVVAGVLLARLILESVTEMILNILIKIGLVKPSQSTLTDVDEEAGSDDY